MAPTLAGDWAAALRALPEDWDSYGAPKIGGRAINTVKAFAVTPCSDGGVQLEIHQDGYDIEIVIRQDGTIEGVLVSHEKSK